MYELPYDNSCFYLLLLTFKDQHHSKDYYNIQHIQVIFIIKL